MKWIACIIFTALCFPFAAARFIPPHANENPRIISYIIDPRLHNLRFYWKDDQGQLFGSIQHLKDQLASKGQRLVFAMNGGMFKSDFSPVGLFIQDHKEVVPPDTSSGNGNFYLKPNGVFYLTDDNKAFICTTPAFHNDGQIRYATQSGPMLLINGSIHPAFQKGSQNLLIRNGVGILPNNQIIFAISSEPINFYDLANYFKNLGCKDALYLDGYVSRAYIPEKDCLQTDGQFGVMIAVEVLSK